MSIIEELKQFAEGEGNAKVVHISIGSYYFANSEFIQACVTEIEHAARMNLALGEPVSPCQKLVLEILTTSAGIDRDNYEKTQKD